MYGESPGRLFGLHEFPHTENVLQLQIEFLLVGWLLNLGFDTRRQGGELLAQLALQGLFLALEFALFAERLGNRFAHLVYLRLSSPGARRLADEFYQRLSFPDFRVE
jgi:hypothetical protein